MPRRHQLDTSRRQNKLTDQAPDPMSMHRIRSLVLLVPLLIQSAFAWGQESELAGLGISPGMKPLNLSLPSHPASATSFGYSPPAGLDQGPDLIRLPDLGQGLSPAGDGRGRLPYGSGYEARRQAARETSGPDFSRTSGSGKSPGGGFGAHQGASGGQGRGGRR